MKPPSSPIGADIHVSARDQVELSAEFPGGRIWLRVSHIIGADFDKRAAVQALNEMHRTAWDAIETYPGAVKD